MNEMKKELQKHNAMNRRLFALIYAMYGAPAAYLDVGCGTGAMVNLAHAMGVPCIGLDIIDSPSPHVQKIDLTMGFHLGHQFDLITCLEVMEHIPEDRADIVLQSIAGHRATDGHLIFSAAGPAQDGIGHVNCQLGTYWRSKLDALGLRYQHDLTVKTQLAINLIPHAGRDWLVGNLQVFRFQ